MRQELTSREARIRAILTQKFAPRALEVIDESHLHAGHAGASPQGETHYHVEIRSNMFEGKSRVMSHRLVNDALAPEFESGLHALRLSAKA